MADLHPLMVILNCVTILLLNFSRTSAVAVTEAEQLALESSGDLLPPSPLASRVTRDLTAIRSKFPDVANITHRGNFIPGEVLIAEISKSSLDSINASRFGPSEYRSIFKDIQFIVTFQKPYNPHKLAEALKEELGIANVQPNGFGGKSASVTLKEGASASGENTYVFNKGWGDCISGCIYKHFWTFTTGPEGNSVQLVEERGDKLPDKNLKL